MKPDDFLVIITLLRVSSMSFFSFESIEFFRFQDPSSIIRQRTYRKLADHLRDPVCPIEFLALLAFAAKEPEREHREQIRRLMLQIIDTRREHIKLQLSYKTAQTSNGHSSNGNGFDHDENTTSSSNGDDKPIDYTLYPEYSLTYFLYFLSKSPAFILYDDVEMLHTMTDYILFLLDALLLRCDTTVGLFYKGLLRSIKSSEDATLDLEKNEKIERKDAIKKLHVLVDLAYVILSQRASSLMICRASSNVPLPEMYFKKTRYNHLSSLPKDFQIKLKATSSTTVTEIGTTKRAMINNSELNSTTTTTSPPKTNKRKSDESHEEQKTTKQRKRKLSSSATENEERKTKSKNKRFFFRPFDRIDFVLDSSSTTVNGKKSRSTTANSSSRSRINFTYEKPKLRSSANSSSRSPPTNRKTRAGTKRPSRVTTKTRK